MKATFQVESETGGVVLIDPAPPPDLDEDFAQCLNVLFDPEGRTCAVLDYPDQEWSDVWGEAAQYLNAFSGRERILYSLVKGRFLCGYRISLSLLKNKSTSKKASPEGYVFLEDAWLLLMG